MSNEDMYRGLTLSDVEKLNLTGKQESKSKFKFTMVIWLILKDKLTLKQASEWSKFSLRQIKVAIKKVKKAAAEREIINLIA